MAANVPKGFCTISLALPERGPAAYGAASREAPSAVHIPPWPIKLAPESPWALHAAKSLQCSQDQGQGVVTSDPRVGERSPREIPELLSQLIAEAPHK